MPQFPQRDLTNQYISTSYQDVVQRYASGSLSFLLDGLGYVILGVPNTSLGGTVLTQDQTASWAQNAVSASWAPGSATSNSSSWASASISSSYAQTASYAFTSSYELEYEISTSWASSSHWSDSASFASRSLVSVSSSWASESFHSQTTDVSISSSYALYSELSNTASLAIMTEFADTASLAGYAYAAGVSVSSSWASASISSSYSDRALSASWAPGGGNSTSSSWASASLVAISASWASASFVATSASYASASTLALIADVALLADTASIAYQSDTASYVEGYDVVGPVSESLFADQALTADTASFAWNSDTASIAISASWAPMPATSDSASWASASLSSSYLNIGATIYLSQSYIKSVTGSTQPPYSPATMWWDDNAKTYAIYPDHQGVALQIGQESWLRSIAGEFIPNGSAVYVTSSVGNIPVVKLGLADGIVGSNKYQVVGIATEDILSGSIGIVTTFGQVHDLDTSMFIEGRLLYLSDTISGSYRQTAPPDPAQLVGLGYVISSNSGSGIIQVNVSNIGATDFPFVGMTSVPIITTGSISPSGSVFMVGSASVNLCTTSDGLGVVRNYRIPSSSFALTSSFADTQYVVANYNSGSPVYQLITDRTLIDNIQTTIVLTVLNGYNNTLVYSDWDTPGILLADKDFARVQALRGVEREDGCVLGTTASVNSGYYTITSGHAWQGVNRLTLDNVNSTSSRVILVAHSASVWSGSVISEVIYNKYDDGTNLVNLPSGDFVVNWVYRTDVNTNATLVVLSDRFGTANLAVASQQPELPPDIKDYAFLTGRVIARNAAAVANRIYEVDSAYTETFLPAGITNHNQLSNLQGGDGIDYYHLDSASYANVVGQHSASWASSSLSSSYAVTASSLTGWNFNNQSSSVGTGSNVIISVSTGSYIAAFFDYAVTSGSNIRAGTIFGSWVNGLISFAETSNTDIGNTSQVSMSMSLSASQVRLIATVSSTIPWNIRALGRYL